MAQPQQGVGGLLAFHQENSVIRLQGKGMQAIQWFSTSRGGRFAKAVLAAIVVHGPDPLITIVMLGLMRQ
jgi:hypothetical protein